MLMNAPLSEVLQDAELVNMMPDFFQLVLRAPIGECLVLQFDKEIAQEDFIKFLEYCYCDKVLSPITGNQTQALKSICAQLGLAASANVFDRLYKSIRLKLEEAIIKDLELSMQVVGKPIGLVPANLTPE